MVVWKTILTRILSATYSINTMFLSTCYSDGGVGGYGMSWFDAMECCYYNKVAHQISTKFQSKQKTQVHKHTISRATLLSRRARMSRQRLRSTSRSCLS